MDINLNHNHNNHNQNNLNDNKKFNQDEYDKIQNIQ